METNTSSSVRVLIRPPSSSTPPLPPSLYPAPSSSPPDPPLPPIAPPPTLSRQPSPPSPSPAPAQAPSSSQPRPSDGIVVVGFIGRRPDDVTPLINRVLDSNVFGSGNLDKDFCVEKEEVKGWFKNRRISYYHEAERGVLYLQYCSTQCPAMEGVSELQSDFDALLEERDFGDLQGLLFMFSVCHVIIYVQEGSRFDTHFLKKFRTLQAAKHALVPSVRSRTAAPLLSKPHSLSSSRAPVSASSSNSPSPGRSRGMLNRNASAISLMSGLGSYTSLFPGQCTPVTLFAFLDDFSDLLNPGSNVEDSTDISSFNQSSSLSSFSRPSLPTKGSGPVVVLARPVNKSEGGLRKKQQSSLESQIRFLIKKCRTLTGSETTHAGSRNAGGASSAPLFSLDASRAVVLLERCKNRRGESLEFATSLVEDVLNGKASSDLLLHESHGQIANKEDVQSVKEFIFRQSDILRGRGGLVANTNSGSAAGVGMVAVAAAAAAASAASGGKTFTTPELPSLDFWISSSQTILRGLLSAKRGCIEEAEISKRKSRQRNTVPAQNEVIAPRCADPAEIAVSWLECGKGLNMKFSTLWCQRALPAAKDIYLKELPACYPTSQHEVHLEKALRAFCSMVKGPAVQLFMKRLEDECTSIWISGRQQCDAVSLTGKPCVHQRHDVEGGGLLAVAKVMPHSSGFVFLHACACGRSRQLRYDPFDFESANVTFNHFPDCEKLLPALQLPKLSHAGPLQPSSWSLIRVGGARYYEPSKGLLQSGFSATQKFLLKWTIFLERWKNPTGASASIVQIPVTSTIHKVESTVDADLRKSSAAHIYPGEVQSGLENRRKSSENIKSIDNKISFGRGLPNFSMKKPFSEVVAGSAAADSGFPPLQQSKQPLLDYEKGTKQNKFRDRIQERIHPAADHQDLQNSENISPVQETLNATSANKNTEGNPFLQIGSNVVPVNVDGGGNNKLNPSLKHVTVYVGFEHECPHGHRFLLTQQHLNELGSSYLLPEESLMPSAMENLNCKPVGPVKLVRNAGNGKVHRNSNGMTSAALNRVRNLDKSKEIVPNGNHYSGGLMQTSEMGKDQEQTSACSSTLQDSGNNIEECFQTLDLDDGGCAFSMLNRNLPIYMNCPHCKISRTKKDPTKNKFASTISQLQRIFLVTPPFPVVLATRPIIQFEASCLPTSASDLEQKLQFSLGCQVILPPESFLTLRLPFIYGVQLEDQSLHPLKPFEHQPELTAWLIKGTTLQVLSREEIRMRDFECS